ncbi:hypothetical protein V2I01_23380 [Micromonospora sp. BRA006-A]|nr:hypothetical protein [Micromonospora sp. BRA006-A]
MTGEGSTVDATGERTTAPRLSWPVTVDPGAAVTLRWRLAVTDPRAVVTAAPAEPGWAEPQVTADDRRLLRLLDRSLADLRGLRLAEPAHPGDVFLGAGVPWFLTLFGRDSLWAARMMLPLGTDLAVGTLRVLARRQGTRVDPATGEQPGKILHELRRHEFAPNEGSGRRRPTTAPSTPPCSGSACSTTPGVGGCPPTRSSRCCHIWRRRCAGSPSTPTPTATASSSTSTPPATASPPGLEGLRRRGALPRRPAGRAPIVLAEVQGYAYRAATDGADLLDAFGRPGADRWRGYADRLAARFRSTFWVDGRHGLQPALALDRDSARWTH